MTCQKMQRVCLCVSNIKSFISLLCIILYITWQYVIFFGLTVPGNPREVGMFHFGRRWEEFLDVVSSRKLTLCLFMSSDMVIPVKYEHLHFVYHFTRPLCIEIMICYYLVLQL